MLHLHIITPEGSAFEGDASEIYLRLAGGPIGIYPGHTTFVGEILHNNVLKAKTEEGYRYFALSHGALEVKPDDEVYVLTGEVVESNCEEEASKVFALEPSGEKEE